MNDEQKKVIEIFKNVFHLSILDTEEAEEVAIRFIGYLNELRNKRSK